MNLLPKSTKEFASKEYWNTFFSSRGKDPFEWYGEYTALAGLLHTYVRAADAVLVAGCGSSALSADLYRVGYRNITNVDVSAVVVQQMQDRYGALCPGMTWLNDDLTRSQLPSEGYSCVLDKGTLDALCPPEEEESADHKGDQYLAEVGRLLRPGGRYVCVSLLQEHVLARLLQHCQGRGWLLRMCRCQEAEGAVRAEGRPSLPVFVAVATKLRAVPGVVPFLESCLDSPTPVRVSPAELRDRVCALQEYSAATHALLSKVSSGEEATLQLCSSSGAVRYTLHVLDAPRGARCSLPMGVFIVPQGREVEWLFGDPEGRRQVLQSAGAGRLVVVHLMPGQIYENNLQQVQDELSSRVRDLAPHGLAETFKIPFLSAGADARSATRVCTGRSEHCGEYVVEDVRGDEGEATMRRLVFLDNPNVVQSEARILPAVSSSSRKPRPQHGSGGGGHPDPAYLSCRHHHAIVAGLGLLRRDARLLLLGLGGGPLATFIHHHLVKAHLDTVELDEAMVRVARDWFGFRSGPHLTVTVMDGLLYCAQWARGGGERYDALILDVDSKDVTVGMSCPPQAFLEPDFLQVMANCLRPDGVLLLNVVCRDSVVWDQTVARLRVVFGRLLCQGVPGEVNRVLLCRRDEKRAREEVPREQPSDDGKQHTPTLNRCSGEAEQREYGDTHSNCGYNNGVETKQEREDTNTTAEKLTAREEGKDDADQPGGGAASLHGRPGKKNKQRSKGQKRNTRGKTELLGIQDEEQQEDKLLIEFTRGVNRICNVLKSKNGGKDVLNTSEIVKCTVVL